MTATEIVTLLAQRFGDGVRAKNLEAIDPFVVVDAADLVATVQFLKEEPRLSFDLLHSISGVDYLELDP